MKKITLFDMEFESMTLTQAANNIVRVALDREKGLVVTPNVDHIVTMETDIEMKKIFQNALFRFADGMPLVWFSRLVYSPGLPGRVTGADLLFAVAEQSSRTDVSIFLLGGGQPDSAKLAAENLLRRYQGLKLAGYYCPQFGFEYDKTESHNIVEMINNSKAQILFIGVGTPKQEKWASYWLPLLKVGPVLGVGAAFDMAAGKVIRAPKIFQNAGLEWLWRLAAEPRRLWRRYIIKDSRFLILAVREFVRITHNKAIK